MGRREVAAGSSPISAESSFRELDDVFLQTQTRIWLGEVLNMRLDEQLRISDLLADGDLLYEVSKVVWNMLLGKCPELRRLKYKPLDSRKSSGRYRPYSNVDSFLKVCKILGLNGIDLFSPSDVVEKRNIRKVCICVRTLSKKARLKHLKVPDFDMVTYTVSMPKDIVGGIRRSLETSQSSFSSSSSYSSYKDQRQKDRQKNLTEAGGKNYDSCSEESDEAESKYMGEESYCSSTDNINHIATLNSDCEKAPVVCSSNTKSSTERSLLHSDIHDQHIYENGFNQFGSESTKCPFPQHVRSNHSLDGISSSCNKSHRKLHRRASHQNDNVKRSLDNEIMNFDHVDLSMGNYAHVRDSMYDNEADRNYISDYLAFSDSVIGGADGNSPVLLEGEDNIFNFFMGIDSHWPRSGQCLVDECENKFSDDIEDLEVSSTASVSSLLGRALNLEFDDHFDIDGSLNIDAHNALLDNEGCGEDRGSFRALKARDVADDKCRFYDVNGSVQTKPEQLCFIRSLDNSSVNKSLFVPSNSYEALEEKHPCFSVKDSADASGPQCTEFPNEAENVSNGEDETTSGVPKDKVHRRPFLHTVARGTAIFGVMFLLLHLSRRDREKNSETNRKPPQTNKFKGRDMSYREKQNGGRDRIYPADKLKFEN